MTSVHKNTAIQFELRIKSTTSFKNFEFLACADAKSENSEQSMPTVSISVMEYSHNDDDWRDLKLILPHATLWIQRRI